MSFSLIAKACWPNFTGYVIAILYFNLYGVSYTYKVYHGKQLPLIIKNVHCHAKEREAGSRNLRLSPVVEKSMSDHKTLTFTVGVFAFEVDEKDILI
ncbi:hypothetical protein CCS41_02425 [Candidatus Fukatsuia symbiotica]|uniref:Uncharacterized protein n=1 Tax=Candidatus Fukatsuia symbiotica TaxID=1878942 RepID=A0A2U8I3C9_9GAMM|nr:hypothetical protein [Candidatus Fukatsuia symbiotica]AWK13613.1 hypothetical protein CCS41_02425 [Candidatus Fukatsuia symbiotica]